MIDVKIKTKDIKLDSFLKWANLVMTGGEAKYLIKIMLNLSLMI